MGFWDSAGKLAKDAAKDALDNVREFKALHDRLEGLSNAELMRIVNDNGFFCQASDMEKRAARAILRNRGEH
ncbi:transposase [Edwardsiella tarda]